MKALRLLVPEGQTGVYHVVSRVVEKRKHFGPEEKMVFTRMMKEYAEFCGVHLLSWVVMSNHFHILVEIPPVDRARMPEGEVLRRLSWIYREAEVDEVREQLAERQSEEEKRELLDRYTCRMGDLRQFMKSVKQRFTQWFNKRHGRMGTLWEHRYHSVVVEGAVEQGSGDFGRVGGGGLSHAARVVAAYIDLNPVRAGMVRDPAEYPWSSYGAAVGGKDEEARAGVARLWGKDAEEGLQAHRMLVFVEGSEERVPADGERSTRVGIAHEKVEEVQRQGGRVPLPLALRVRVRSMSMGAVIGSEAFVRQVYEGAQGRLVRKRGSPGGAPLSGGEWGGLHAFSGA